MARGNFKYDWPDIQRYYDEGHGYLECRARYGFAKDTWRKAILERRLIEGGMLRNVCDECGLREWRGKPLTIQIDHRNGIHDDHRLENLRMLCPNCHSQTETYAARNRRRGTKRRI